MEGDLRIGAKGQMCAVVFDRTDGNNEGDILFLCLLLSDFLLLSGILHFFRLY